MILVKSKLRVLAMFLLLSITLVACNKPNNTDGTEMGSKTETGEKQENSKDSADKKIVLYSNSFADEKITWLEEKSKEAGFDVEVVFIPGGDLLQRLIAEKNDPQADVVIGLDEGGFSKLQGDNMFVEWNPDWKSEIDSDLIYGDGYYYPWAEQRIFYYYDGNQLTEADAPKSYEELATEKFKDQYYVPGNLTSSTNQKIVFPILLQNLDENGELGVSEKGWQLAKDYYKYGKTVEAENSLGSLQKAITMVKDGELKFSYYFSGGIIKAEKEFDIKAVPINPEKGVFAMAEQVGVMNHGKDADYTVAKEFAEWWGTAEVQKAWAKDFGTVPANNNAREAADPRVLELFEQTDRMNLDWNVLNEHLDEWVEKFELEIMP